MSAVNGIEKLKLQYPTLSVLDLHYLSMKCFGVQDEKTETGRPSLNLIDEANLYHITFTTDDQTSPYRLQDHTILYHNHPLPFRIVYVERIPVKVRRYYYLRSSRYLTPSLHDELILNLNFRHQCYHCSFCQNLVCGSQQNISVEDGFNLIMSRGDIADLTQVKEIAIVTGAFSSGCRVYDHLVDVINAAVTYGFSGRIFYMGYELTNPVLIDQILKLMQVKGLQEFKLAFTVEMFKNRSRLMKGCKGSGSLNEIVEIIKQLSRLGIYNLQYSYIPGLDDIDDFKRGAEKISPFAEPHLSIYRQFSPEQRQAHISRDFGFLGPDYLCQIRLFYEQLYGRKLYGNNLGNMFPFPLNQISPRWVTGSVIGNIDHLRYWQEDARPAGWRVVH